jgi:hypothetical protein
VNQEEQRVAIAEACGWTLNPAKHTAKGLDWLHVPSGKTTYNPPNYLNDLNAMHEAEETLDCNQWEVWHRIVGEWPTELARLTASQRAEAFLRTIGKWKEAKP